MPTLRLILDHNHILPLLGHFCTGLYVICSCMSQQCKQGPYVFCKVFVKVSFSKAMSVPLGPYGLNSLKVHVCLFRSVSTWAATSYSGFQIWQYMFFEVAVHHP